MSPKRIVPVVVLLAAGGFAAWNLVWKPRATDRDGLAASGTVEATDAQLGFQAPGRIVELGPVADVIHRPEHPYTVGLMGSIPSLVTETERLAQIDGAMPRLNAIPAGCAFNPRCTRVFERCRSERPNLVPVNSTQAACWLHAR